MRGEFMSNKKEDLENLGENGGIEWFWVIAGSIIGLILIGSFVFITSLKFHTHAIPYLIGALSFAVTGMILGHFSPGHTVKEAAVAGLIIPVVGISMIYLDIIKSPMQFGDITFEILNKDDLTIGVIIILIVGGGLLTQLGGWVGEELEGYDHPTKFIQWHWIIVASVIGFILNCYVLFFLVPLVFKLIPILIFLALSLLVSGIIAGYKSPGHTELECGIAGVVTILLDYLFLKIGLDYSDELIPFWYLLVGIVGGAVFGLLGGYLGEKIQTKEAAEQKELE